MKKYIDKIWFGTICGLLAPGIGFIVYFYLVDIYKRLTYGVNYEPIEFSHWVEVMSVPQLASGSLSISIFITNLLLFFIFIWTALGRAAGGVIFSTILYAALSMYLIYFA